MSDIGVTTPSPISTPNSSIYTLSEQINAATRPTHSQLNRLIVARLPLALPPHASTPNTYLTGLIHIASIYGTFESLWQTILDAPHLPTTLNKVSFDACDPDHPLIDSNTSIPLLRHRPKVCTRTHSLLTHLHLPGLLRTGRIRADIQVLSGLSDNEIDVRLKDVLHDSPLADFVAHIKHSVETNTHVLLAYAWVFYMALFSGGRFLRLSLCAAGPVFWGGSQITSPFAHQPNPFVAPSDQTPRPSLSQGRATNHDRKVSRSDSFAAAQPVLRKFSRSDNSISIPISPTTGLKFFNFTGDEDGEDIKFEFKKRVAEAEILLTSGEKDDIIQEAQDIFRFMIELVGELDGICNTFGTKGDESDSSDESTGSVVKTILKTAHPDSSNDSVAELLDYNHGGKHALAVMRSRDSVAVNHDRIRKRNDTVTQKDSIPPKEQELLLKRSTTIHFKGEDRKSSFAMAIEPFEKIVRWGGCETVRRKFSTQTEGLRRKISDATTWENGRVVLASIVLVLVVMEWWILWLFGWLL